MRRKPGRFEEKTGGIRGLLDEAEGEGEAPKRRGRREPEDDEDLDLDAAWEKR